MFYIPISFTSKYMESLPAPSSNGVILHGKIIDIQRMYTYDDVRANVSNVLLFGDNPQAVA